MKSSTEYLKCISSLNLNPKDEELAGIIWSEAEKSLAVSTLTKGELQSLVVHLRKVLKELKDKKDTAREQVKKKSDFLRFSKDTNFLVFFVCFFKRCNLRALGRLIKAEKKLAMIQGKLKRMISQGS